VQGGAAQLQPCVRAARPDALPRRQRSGAAAGAAVPLPPERGDGRLGRAVRHLWLRLVVRTELELYEQ